MHEMWIHYWVEGLIAYVNLYGFLLKSDLNLCEYSRTFIRALYFTRINDVVSVMTLTYAQYRTMNYIDHADRCNIMASEAVPVRARDG